MPYTHFKEILGSRLATFLHGFMLDRELCDPVPRSINIAPRQNSFCIINGKSNITSPVITRIPPICFVLINYTFIIIAYGSIFSKQKRN